LRPPEAESHLVGSNTDFAVATLGSYVLLLWRKKTGLQAVTWVRKAFADFLRDHPDEKISFLTVVQADCALGTSEEIRKALADLLGTYKSNLAGAAVAFEAQGFQMTVLRSVITAVNIATRARFPNAVFAHTGDAVAWLRDHSTGSDPGIRVHHLIATLDRIR
jgi:hypothetical protein